MSKVAIIAGSSGLIGHELLKQLCDDPLYEKVITLVRQASGFHHKKVSEIIIRFDQPETFESSLAGDVLFSCLGSTRRKTPDRNQYYKIDHDYPLKLATIAHQNGITQMHIISSLGANERSGNFYLKMKGETERDIAAIPFRSVHIYRPSFLDGNRKEKRLLEKAGLKVFAVIRPLLRGKLKKYRSISAKVVARAMIRNASDSTTGINIYESDTIQDIGSL